MKSFLLFSILLFIKPLFSQQNEGAIKTKNGFLLYFNIGTNSHTLNLNGEVDLSHFPFIKQDNIQFQFYKARKDEFGNESKSILINYMNWEVDYYQQQLNVKLNVSNEVFNKNGLSSNFWKFKNPIIENDKIYTPVVATYFLDFIHNDYIYRFSYASINGDDLEAKTILLKLADSIKFYDKNLDLNKLQQNILEGKNYIEN